MICDFTQGLNISIRKGLAAIEGVVARGVERERFCKLPANFLRLCGKCWCNFLCLPYQGVAESVCVLWL